MGPSVLDVDSIGNKDNIDFENGEILQSRQVLARNVKLGRDESVSYFESETYSFVVKGWVYKPFLIPRFFDSSDISS